MSGFQTSIETGNGVTIVRLVGSGDFGHTDAFARRCDQIAAERPSYLVIDISGLEFIASLMVGQIVALGKSVKTNGGRAAIAGPNTDIRGVLERCRMTAVMPVFASVEEAVAAHGLA